LTLNTEVSGVAEMSFCFPNTILNVLCDIQVSGATEICLNILNLFNSRYIILK